MVLEIDLYINVVVEENCKCNIFNYEIDMCMFYGCMLVQMKVFRVKNLFLDQCGFLCCQDWEDGEYLFFLFKDGEIDLDFKDIFDLFLGFFDFFVVMVYFDLVCLELVKVMCDCLFVVGGDCVNLVF